MKAFGQEILSWAKRVFGPIALDRRERALRLLEEAAELAQVEGVPAEMATAVVERVFSRPVGTIAEIGAVVMTLEALAANVGVDLEAAGQAEFERCLSLDPHYLASRHRAKIEIGCAISPDQAVCS